MLRELNFIKIHIKVNVYNKMIKKYSVRQRVRLKMEIKCDVLIIGGDATTEAARKFMVIDKVCCGKFGDAIKFEMMEGI